MDTLPTILEDRLIDGLQPIRGFVLAQALYHFMGSGIHEVMITSPDLTVKVLAQTLGLQERRLRGLLQYLANEEFVRLADGDRVSLTTRGEAIADFRPWYNLLVGGYAETFQQLSLALQEGRPYAERNSSNVAIGSCGISQYDALPMTRRLLKQIPVKWSTVVDVGCGDGSYLVDLCRSMPDVRGVGLDPNPVSVQAAVQASARCGFGDRIDVRVGRASSLPDLSHEAAPLAFITAFVLQEELEQSGRNAVVELLRSAFDRYPDSYWVVVEVDHRPTDTAVMKTGLGLAYYNPYYLIHSFTEQRLERVEFWESLFHEAALNVVAMERPDPSYDSLGLKVGFLLTRVTHNS